MPVSTPSSRSSSSTSLGTGPTAGAPHLIAASSPALGSANGRKPRRNLAKQTARRCRLIEEKLRAMAAEQEATRERILRERKEKYRQVVLATKPDWDKGTWDPQQQLRVARASAVEVVKPRAEPSSHLASAYTSRSPSPAPPPDSPVSRTTRAHSPPAPTPPGPPATAPSVITPAFGPSPTLPPYDPSADFSDSSMSDDDGGVSGSGGHRRGTLRLSEAAIRLLESNVKMKVSQAKAMMLGASGPAGAPPGGPGSAPRLLQPLPPEKQRILLASGDDAAVRRPSVAMARRWAHSDSLLYSGSTARAADEFGDVVIASTATKLDLTIRTLVTMWTVVAVLN
ncbi:hypothetical protein GGF32_001819 [Allomyces javanicus]|nr:hypothetical protein GGF32_001819 [Allomyces javanicus]